MILSLFLFLLSYFLLLVLSFSFAIIHSDSPPECLSLRLPSMDFFRRWQQTSSYPRRPSPLATSQEPHPDPPRPYATSVSASASSSSDVHSRPEPDPTRFQYSSPTPTAPSISSAQTYLSLHSPPSNTHRLPPHRRDGSLDTQDRTQSHRRIHSQPQDLRSSEGELDSFVCPPGFLLIRGCSCASTFFLSFPFHFQQPKKSCGCTSPVTSPNRV